MPQLGYPRRALEAARSHLGEAMTTDPSDRLSFAYRLEAALVASRSVWQYLQKADQAAVAFTASFKAITTAMNLDPLIKDLRDERDLIIHERPLGSSRGVDLRVRGGKSSRGGTCARP